MLYRSHRGGVYYVPENTMPAFYDAIDKKFASIETDPCYSKDGKIILMHDPTINRTCMNPDGTEIEKDVFAAECTYEELLYYDAGIRKGEQFKGTKIPLLEELLALTEDKDVVLTLDKKIPTSDMEPLFALLEQYKSKVRFLTEDVERTKTVVERFPDALIDYDGPMTDEMLGNIKEIVKPGNFVAWLYLDKPNFAWLPAIRKVSAENCARAKRYANIGIANINNPYDVYEAMQFDPYMIEI